MYYISVTAFGTLRLRQRKSYVFNNTPAMQALYAGVAELADAQDLNPRDCGLRVSIPVAGMINKELYITMVMYGSFSCHIEVQVVQLRKIIMMGDNQ